MEFSRDIGRYMHIACCRSKFKRSTKNACIFHGFFLGLILQFSHLFFLSYIGVKLFLKLLFYFFTILVVINTPETLVCFWSAYRQFFFYKIPPGSYEVWWFYSRYPFSEKHGVHPALAQFSAQILPRWLLLTIMRFYFWISVYHFCPEISSRTSAFRSSCCWLSSTPISASSVPIVATLSSTVFALCSDAPKVLKKNTLQTWTSLSSTVRKHCLVLALLESPSADFLFTLEQLSLKS